MRDGRDLQAAFHGSAEDEGAGSLSEKEIAKCLCPDTISEEKPTRKPRETFPREN